MAEELKETKESKQKDSLVIITTCAVEAILIALEIYQPKLYKKVLDFACHEESLRSILDYIVEFMQEDKKND